VVGSLCVYPPPLPLMFPAAWCVDPQSAKISCTVVTPNQTSRERLAVKTSRQTRNIQKDSESEAYVSRVFKQHREYGYVSRVVELNHLNMINVINVHLKWSIWSMRLVLLVEKPGGLLKWNTHTHTHTHTHTNLVDADLLLDVVCALLGLWGVDHLHRHRLLRLPVHQQPNSWKSTTTTTTTTTTTKHRNQFDGAWVKSNDELPNES